MWDVLPLFHERHPSKTWSGVSQLLAAPLCEKGIVLSVADGSSAREVCRGEGVCLPNGVIFCPVMGGAGAGPKEH